MIKVTNEGLKILVGINDEEFLYINSNRISDCLNYLQKNNLRNIIIDDYHNYKSDKIDFLIELKDYLEGLVITENKYNYTIINKLHNLKQLSIIDNSKDIIDLNNFPKIESLGVNFTSRLLGLESCENLISLTINNLKTISRNLTTLPKLNKLEELSILKSNLKSLEGIYISKKLKKVEIYQASNLELIDGLKTLSSTLEVIEIEHCKKIVDYSILGEIITLKKILISESADINNLSFIKKIPNLEFINFWGTNVLDGNIKYCEGIKHVGFNNRKHYTHKMEYFAQKNSSL